MITEDDDTRLPGRAATGSGLARRIGRLTLAVAAALGASLMPAANGALDDTSMPPADDPSAYTGPSIGNEFAIDFLATQPPANQGAWEGGTKADTEINNSVPEDEQRTGGSFDVPTGGLPSPLFGAGDFEQRMLRFEEFGTEKFAGAPLSQRPFPSLEIGPWPEQDPDSLIASSPSGAAIDAFVGEPGLNPWPSQFANTTDLNPWKDVIESYLGRPLIAPPIEGRPPGQGWAHQRWNEFFPQAYFKTSQAPSRVNGGMRDSRQLHGYSVGEFAPGGLYHRVWDSLVPDTPVLDGTTAGLRIRIHPRMPIQDSKALWTFDGTLPPKLLIVRHGESLLMREYNMLPVDPSANRGFGIHTITTHLHNGHNPAESDGYANAFFFPGQFWDYRWPLQLAGYDTINTTADDPRAGFPCAPGETLFVNDEEPGLKTCDEHGRINIRGDWRETISAQWFHDHMLDYTAQNVYKGNAAVINYFSAIDRGKEDHDDGVNLRFPSGTALPWGNRDYDVNLLVADKAWDLQGQLWFNIFNTDGFLGDRVLTNWLYKPYFDVRARRYRFRILNGSVSRYFAIALVRKVNGNGGEMAGPPGSGVSYTRVPFHLIANDGNIMEHAVPFDGSIDLDGDGDVAEHRGHLPTQAIAERYDIIVDFAAHGIQPGDRLYFVNTLEHDDGRGAGDKIPLEDVLSGEYQAVMRTDDGVPERWEDGDPAVGPFLELRVVAYAGTDHSMDPSEYEPGGKQMIPLPTDRNDPRLADARHREFVFGRSEGTDEAPWTVRTDGSIGLSADPRRVSAAPRLATGPTAGGFDGSDALGTDGFGTLEIWSLENTGNWSHPVHVHFEEGVILRRDGEAPPLWEMWARKDIYRIGNEEDASDSVEIALRFREFAGTYVEHCHNTQHEDRAMLLRFDVEKPGQFLLMPSPIPTWDGVLYVDSHALPTFRTGDGFGIDGDERDNRAPVFTSLPTDTVAVEGTAWSGQASATDPDPSDHLSFLLVSGPEGMTIDPAEGRLTWTPPLGVLGSQAAVVRVVDLAGATDDEEITLEVAPRLGLTLARYRLAEKWWVVQGQATPGSTVEVRAGASLDAPLVGVANVNPKGNFSLNLQDSPVVPDGSGTISVASSSGAVLLAQPLIAPDVVPLTVTTANYRDGGWWTIRGTTTPRDQVSIHLGPTLAGAVIGTVQAGGVGRFVFEVKDSPVALDGSGVVSLASSTHTVLGQPVQVLDIPPLGVALARYEAATGTWIVRGEGAPRDTVRIHAGATLDGPLLGTITTGGVGRFRLELTGAAVAPDDSGTVSLETDSGEVILGYPVQLR
ncbi:MAG: multicopper oxidase domain-containing protein [Thiohalomonadaceae bacterium]